MVRSFECTEAEAGLYIGTMPLRLGRSITGLALLLAGIAAAACSPTYVVVPQHQGEYSARDTLHGRLKGKEVRVTFHHDTTWRVDTAWRTIYRGGERVDTLLVRDPHARVDTVWIESGRRRFPRVDTVRIVVHDTIRVVDTARVGTFRRPGVRVDTVRVVVHDTVRVTGPGGPGRPGTPGGPNIMPPPPPMRGVDTVRITIHDTVRVTVHDTVRVAVHDTVRVPGRDTGHTAGPRQISVPPGQYPPEGQCRVWIVDRPPGQQAPPAACTALGPIPAGAFVLFGGRAWDFDYDWSRYPGPGTVPPEILALQRGGTSRPSPARSFGPGLRRP